MQIGVGKNDFPYLNFRNIKYLSVILSLIMN